MNKTRDYYSYTIKSIENVAFDTIGKITRKNCNNKKVECAELEEARKEKQEAKRKYSTAWDETQKQAYKTSLIEKTKKLTEVATLAKARETERLIEETMSNYLNDPNTLWKIREKLRPENKEKFYIVKDCNGHRVYSPEKAKETVASYFEKLYTPRQIDEEIISWETYINQRITEHALNKNSDCLKVNEPFTIKEVKDVVKVLKKRKAKGPDDIPNEFMIEGGTQIQTILLNLFNRIWLQEDIPKAWSIAELVCLFKGK